MQLVRVTKGFWKGHMGVIEKQLESSLPFLPEYLVKLQCGKWIWFTPRQLEAIKK